MAKSSFDDSTADAVVAVVIVSVVGMGIHVANIIHVGVLIVEKMVHV